MNKRKSLGRGLDALLSSAAGKSAGARPTAGAGRAGRWRAALRELPVDLLQRGKYQPRVDMREETLAELADRSRRRASCSRSSCGRSSAPGSTRARYEIVAGERRWRAAQIAGLHTVPAVVRDIPDEAAVAVALIENIQREDLNPIEEARVAAAADRGVRAHAPGGRRRGRPLAGRGHEPAAAAGAAAAGPRDARETRARHGARARLARASRRPSCSIELAQRVAKQGCRCARPRPPSGDIGGAGASPKGGKRRGRATATRTCAASRPIWPKRWVRRSRSSTAAKGGARRDPLPRPRGARRHPRAHQVAAAVAAAACR